MGLCVSKGSSGYGNRQAESYDLLDGPVDDKNRNQQNKQISNRVRKTGVSTGNNEKSGAKSTADDTENDTRDNGPVAAGQNRTDLIPNFELIDLDDEEYLTRIQEAYQRHPPKLTRKDLLADVYRMDFPRRGKAIVINNENFRNSPQRKGTFVDFAKICNRLERLGFQVERHIDATCNQILAAFVNSSNEDHSEADCFVGVFLSHGGENEIHGTDGILNLKSIFELFQSNRCKTLAGKPKLFFIQACRGEEFDDGTNVNVADAGGMRSPLEDEVELAIPDDADFLICYSTVSGYYSWRNAQRGSWYIQALVRVLDECGTQLEIRKILTRVNKMVAYNYESKDRRQTRKKQIPSFTSKLTKDLYFKPK